MSRPLFWVRSLPQRGVEKSEIGWSIRHLIKNYRGLMGSLCVYDSQLGVDQIPHELHSHTGAEIIVLLSGRLDIIGPENRVRVCAAGSFFHHPPGDWHTLQSVGPEAARFLVFKWSRDVPSQEGVKASTLIFDAHLWQPANEQLGIQRHRPSEDQPLENGGKLVTEIIRIAPGTGYPVHAHDHDLMLIILRGSLDGLGHQTRVPAVIYYPAGTPHALAPTSLEPIDHLAFEFHSPLSSFGWLGTFMNPPWMPSPTFAPNCHPAVT